MAAPLLHVSIFQMFIFYYWNKNMPFETLKWKEQVLNPLNPKGFCVFERFSAFTRPIGLRDSIFKVTIESAAVLKH